MVRGKDGKGRRSRIRSLGKGGKGGKGGFGSCQELAFFFQLPAIQQLFPQPALPPLPTQAGASSPTKLDPCQSIFRNWCEPFLILETPSVGHVRLS